MSFVFFAGGGPSLGCGASHFEELALEKEDEPKKLRMFFDLPHPRNQPPLQVRRQPGGVEGGAISREEAPPCVRLCSPYLRWVH